MLLKKIIQRNLRRFMEIFNKLVDMLQANNVKFRVVEHQAEGRSEEVSKIRGSDLHQGLKAMVIMAKLTKKDRKYFLAVFPADCYLDMNAIKRYSNAQDAVMLAPLDRAKALTGCEMGAVPPFSFNQELFLLADPSIKINKEVVFNAGVLDKSIFMDIEDYINLAKPVFFEIIK
jgi:Ala-tRNA(Pro) deacylase